MEGAPHYGHKYILILMEDQIGGVVFIYSRGINYLLLSTAGMIIVKVNKYQINF